MSEEVGKVSLGIEFDGNDISKQLEKMTSTMGDSLSKAFESAVKGMDFKPVTASISEALKEITTFDSVIDSIKGKLSGMKIPTVSVLAPTPTAAASPSSKSSAPAKTTEPFDVEKAEAEIERLTQIMDNVNGKIDIQQQKLVKLKEAYDNTYNDNTKLKLQEKILNTESAIMRLTKQSEDAANKVWKLDDAIEHSKTATQQAAVASQQAANATLQASNANKQAAGSAQQSSSSNQQASKSAKGLTGNLNKATKAAIGSNEAFNAASKSAGKMGNQFTQAFGRIAKQVLVFSVLYKAIRGFQSYMNSSMKTNQQYAASLNAIKTNLATAFQPVFSAVMPAINSFMSWLAKATAYIAAFMSSLFGTSYKQSFAAAKGLQSARKELDGYGKAAKKTAKGLSALDDFNLIKTQDDPDSGGGGAKPGDWNMEMPDMDIDSIQAKTDSLVANMKTSFNGVWESIKKGWNGFTNEFGPTFSKAWAKFAPELEGWKTSFGQVFNDVIALGAPLKDWWQTSVIPAWKNGIEAASEIYSGLSESIRLAFDSTWAAVYPIISKFVTEGLPRIVEFVTVVQDIFRSMFDVVKTIFDSIWRDAVDPAIQLVSSIIRDALDILFEWWDTWGKKIVEGIKTALGKIKELFNNLWNSYLKPHITSMLNIMSELWGKHLKGLIKEVGSFVGKLASAALDIFNKFIMPIVNWLVKTLGPIWAEIFNGIVRVIGTALGGVIDAARGIIKALGGIVDFIAGVFTGDWKKAWNGIKDFTSGIGDAIIGVFKGAVNAIIEAFNWMLRQINKVSIDIPDWIPGIGGKNLGFSIPEIPRLAKGGLAYGPTLAMVGDNKGAAADPEVISPLSKLQDMLTGNNAGMEALLMAMLEVLRDIARKSPTFQIGESELGRIAIKAVNTVQRQAGRSLIEV